MKYDVQNETAHSYNKDDKMINDIGRQIEEKFKSSLEAAAKQISNEFANVRPRVSSFVSESSINPTHVLSLECLFPHANPDQPDLIALCITTEHLNTHPATRVDITWGHPSGQVEAELSNVPMGFSTSTLESIEAYLPRLCQKLIEVLKKEAEPAK